MVQVLIVDVGIVLAAIEASRVEFFRNWEIKIARREVEIAQKSAEVSLQILVHFAYC